MSEIMRCLKPCGAFDECFLKNKGCYTHQLHTTYKQQQQPKQFIKAAVPILVLF